MSSFTVYLKDFDAAFATYSRRRSTVRADIDQSFAEEEIGEDL